MFQVEAIDYFYEAILNIFNILVLYRILLDLKEIAPYEKHSF